MGSLEFQDKNAAKNFSQDFYLNSQKKLSRLKQEFFTLYCFHVTFFEFYDFFRIWKRICNG
jgi:hypothetical protein